jgi:hypothetical protein
MGTQSIATFQVTSWDQASYDKPENAPELCRTDVKKVFHGEIEAESSAVLLMCQGDNGGGYVANERIVGRIGDSSGSFVIQHGGAMANNNVAESFGYIVPGSGTGDLRGIRGHCSFRHDEHEAVFTLDYEFV